MSEIKKIIDDAIAKITKLNNNNPDINDVLSQAELLSEQLESISGKVLEDVEKLDLDLTSVDEVLNDAMIEKALIHQVKIDSSGNIADTHYGSKGTLVDPATYWWRGLPVSLELKWVGGAFYCSIIRQSDNHVVAKYNINIMNIFKYVERDTKTCMESLGDDYGHMFGLHVDHSDTCHSKSWHWTDGNNSQ